MAVVLWYLLTPLRAMTPLWARLIVVSLVALAGAAMHLSKGRLRILPNRTRQVPRTWYKRYGAPGALLRYGFALGTAFWTFVPNSMVYVVFAGSALLLPFWAAPITGAAFGIGRTAPVGPAATASHLVARLPLLLGHLSQRAVATSHVVSGLVVVLLLLGAIGWKW